MKRKENLSSPAADTRCFRRGKHVQVHNLPIWSKTLQWIWHLYEDWWKFLLHNSSCPACKLPQKGFFLPSLSSSLPVSRSKQQIASYFFSPSHHVPQNSQGFFFKKIHKGPPRTFPLQQPITFVRIIIIAHHTWPQQKVIRRVFYRSFFKFFFLREKWRSPKKEKNSSCRANCGFNSGVKFKDVALRLIPWCCDTCLQKNKKDFSFLGKGVLRQIGRCLFLSLLPPFPHQGSFVSPLWLLLATCHEGIVYKKLPASSPL